MEKLNEYISDNRLLHFYQKQLSQNTALGSQVKALKGIRLCGSQAILTSARLSAPAVFILSDGKNSRAYGTTSCRSPWACPKCTAKVMAEKGADIGALIDALATWENRVPIMITFTLPHTEKMSCKETFTLLKDTWRAFSHGTNSFKTQYTIKKGTRRNPSQKAGDKAQYKHYRSKYAKFRQELDIKHIVRVYEVTWGKNGWHPHIHALFWIKKSDLQKVAEYEESLFNLWWHQAEATARKFWTNKNPNVNQDWITLMYSDFMKTPNGTHRSLYISKNDDGTIRQMESSYYIAGWSGNMELTGTHLKVAKDGHYTPHQIIQNAYDAQSTEERDKWLKLYVEYSVATRGSKRVCYSPGIRAIINKWKATNKYKQILKKKAMSQAQKFWKVVCWFDPQQWSTISDINRSINTDIILKILELATQQNAREKIKEFLLEYDIRLYDIKHPDESFITCITNGVDPQTGEIVGYVA